jgi:glucan biosynthesis protein C
MASGKTGRLLHIDALRAAAMLFGIFVHATTIQKPNLYPVVGATSDLFRMATFFLLSGYFTALVFSRESRREYVTGRLRVLILPLVVMLLTLVPFTNWLIHQWHNGPMGFVEYFGGGWRMPTRGNDVWHLHLWFMFCLAIYAALTPMLMALLTRLNGELVGRDAFVSSRWFLYLLAGAVGLWSVATRSVNELVLEPVLSDGPFDFIARSTLQYLAFFVIGALCFTNAAVFRALHRFDVLGLVLSGGALALAVAYGDELPRTVERILYFATRGALTLFVIAALIALFERLFRKASGTLSFVVAAAYTFYLVHMTVIYVIATVVGHALDLHLVYWIVVAVGLPATLAVHRYLVAPSPVLSLIFNGKAQRGAAAGPAQPSR